MAITEKINPQSNVKRANRNNESPRTMIRFSKLIVQSEKLWHTKWTLNLPIQIIHSFQDLPKITSG